MNNDNYVYLHKRKDNDKVFYIGEGRLNRAETKIKRSKLWNNIVKEAGGYTIEYLATNLTKAQAVNLENSLLIDTPIGWDLINVAPARDTNLIDQELLTESLIYDSLSPSSLRWKNKKSGNFKADYSAGYLDKVRGYWQVRLNSKLYAAHRLVWVLHNGNIPSGMVINHIDNNPSNNLIDNLELVTQAINSRRSKLNVNVEKAGIYYCVVNKYKYWTACYYDLNSKRKTKSFDCDKLGDEVAKEKAIKWRKENLMELNKQGAGYNV